MLKDPRFLTEEELMIVFLTEVEAVINSRPLTYDCNNLGEPEPYTPANVLVQKRLSPKCMDIC